MGRVVELSAKWSLIAHNSDRKFVLSMRENADSGGFGACLQGSAKILYKYRPIRCTDFGLTDRVKWADCRGQMGIIRAPCGMCFRQFKRDERTRVMPFFGWRTASGWKPDLRVWEGRLGGARDDDERQRQTAKATAGGAQVPGSRRHSFALQGQRQRRRQTAKATAKGNRQRPRIDPPRAKKQGDVMP